MCVQAHLCVIWPPIKITIDCDFVFFLCLYSHLSFRKVVWDSDGCLDLSLRFSLFRGVDICHFQHMHTTCWGRSFWVILHLRATHSPRCPAPHLIVLGLNLAPTLGG